MSYLKKIESSLKALGKGFGVRGPGGYDSPKSEEDRELDTTITIESALETVWLPLIQKAFHKAWKADKGIGVKATKDTVSLKSILDETSKVALTKMKLAQIAKKAKKTESAIIKLVKTQISEVKEELISSLNKTSGKSVIDDGTGWLLRNWPSY